MNQHDDCLFIFVFIFPVPPNIVDETSSGDTLATEGRSVTLNCDATGTPKPSITWRREDGEMIRLCGAPNYGLEDNCTQVKEYVGDSLTLVNINRYVTESLNQNKGEKFLKHLLRLAK